MAESLKRVPMTNVDKAWLEMDSSVNLMIINGVMLFEEKLDFALMKWVLEKRLVERYPRFRQRVVAGRGGRLYWETDPHFDIRAHVRRYALPEPGDLSMLHQIVSAVINEPLDRRKPLWRFLLIENVDGGCAILGRLHHALADGIALIRVLLSMTSDSPEASLRMLEEAPARPRHHAPGPLGMAAGLLQTSLNVTKTVISEAVQTIEHPSHPMEVARSAGIISAASAAILAKLLILPPDRRSVFKGELGAIKRVVWSEEFDLAQIKAIGKGLGATVNDVLVSAVAGSLRSYMLERGDDPERGDINAMVPVNLRMEGKETELGNQFALVYLSLPVSLADPLDRLLATKQHMDVLKNSPEPFLVYQILGALGVLPLDLAKQTAHWFSTKASAVLTNVPGPRNQIYLAGKPLKNIMFWVPQSGEISVGISIISYNGKVTLGVMVDEHLIPNPQAIIDGFKSQLVLLAERVTQLAEESSLSPGDANGLLAHNGDEPDRGQNHAHGSKQQTTSTRFGA